MPLRQSAAAHGFQQGGAVVRNGHQLDMKFTLHIGGRQIVQKDGMVIAEHGLRDEEPFAQRLPAELCDQILAGDQPGNGDLFAEEIVPDGVYMAVARIPCAEYG